MDEGEVVEDTEDEPSIFSSDPNERKLARRLRIKRRLEAAERLQAIADGTYVEPEPEKPLLDQTIESSDDTLIQLFLEGKELVTNVRIASDAREVQRREAELEARNLRFKKLEEEAALAMEKLNEITGKWENIQDSNDPLNLYQDMMGQKAKCLELIEQKNGLIEDFQVELKMADERFMKDRRKMYEDIAMMTQRIDEQVMVMKRGYRHELQIIENSVDTTRMQVLEEHQKTWQALYDQREQDEVTDMERKFTMVDRHESELRTVHREHEEKYRETKIRLETDIQTLEQELEQVKALCLLNSEKLDYNYQVLKKREEENVYIKNHQKRRLNKLQDLVNTLKKKIDDKQNATEQELKRLTQEVQRYHTNVIDIERKADHFSQVNEEKYQNIWDMKTDEANELLDKILTTDMIIHEQVLGLDWKPPEIQLIEKTELPSFKSAMLIVSELFKDGEEEGDSSLVPYEPQEMQPSEIEKGHKRLLRHILEMVADQSGFLIEEKLDELLKPYNEEEKTFVRLDNVFMAIGIRTEKDIDLIKEVFLPYATCSICENRKISVASLDMPDESSDKTESRDSREPREQSVLQIRELEEKVSQLAVQPMRGPAMDSDMAGMLKQDEIDPLLLGQRETKAPSPPQVQCNVTHPLSIEKIYVLKALREFVTRLHSDKFGTQSALNVRLAKQRCTISRLLSKEDVETYWQRFKEIFPPEEEKVWDALFAGLTKYHVILQERHKLNLKAQKLRYQNMELRRLLGRYISEDGTNEQRFCLPNLGQSSSAFVKSADLMDIINKVSF